MKGKQICVMNLGWYTTGSLFCLLSEAGPQPACTFTMQKTYIVVHLTSVEKFKNTILGTHELHSNNV